MPLLDRPPEVRVATFSDVEALTVTMTTAFFDDPLWGPAFPDVEQRAAQAGALWRLCLASALRYPWTLITEKAESAALWIPPGGTELTAAEEAGLGDLLMGAAGRSVADTVLAILGQLEEARPGEPHFYLSLFGTHSSHRGAGLGMRLLRENLTRIDALGAAAYLESSNPANNARYQSVGFTPRSEIITATGHVVTTMWRSPR